MESTGNLFVYEGRGIISGEEGWVVCVEFMRVAVDLPAPVVKEKGIEHLVYKGRQFEKWRYYLKLEDLM